MTPSPQDIRVIVVDDEEDFREPVVSFLRKQGMTVSGVGSVEELMTALPETNAQIIVLDINLPGQSGLEAVEKLRIEYDLGVIMATARRGVEDRILGLSLGADSYMEKPLNLRELEIVIRNLWSRLPGNDPHNDSEAWLLSTEDWTLTAPDGVSVHLTGTEYHVISLLAREPGAPVSRNTLSEALGKTFGGPDDRSLDVMVSRLRRKFTASEHALPLKSVRNVGYAFPKLQVNE